MIAYKLIYAALWIMWLGVLTQPIYVAIVAGGKGKNGALWCGGSFIWVVLVGAAFAKSGGTILLIASFAALAWPAMAAKYIAISLMLVMVAYIPTFLVLVAGDNRRDFRQRRNGPAPRGRRYGKAPKTKRGKGRKIVRRLPRRKKKDRDID